MKKLTAVLMFSLFTVHSASISTMTCSGGTVTVNATAHGLVSQQGFSITGSNVPAYNINSTAASVSANSLTFKLPCSGSASGGTIQAAKQIINIGSSVRPDAGTVTFNYVFWFTTSNPIVPACAANAGGCISAWAGASAAENAAISAGTTIEQVGAIALPAATSAASTQSIIQGQYSTIQTAFASFLLSGTGYWFNGSAWVNQ